MLLQKYTWSNVAYYDNIFRHLMAEFPHRNWGETYGEMWNMAMCEPLSLTRGQGNSFRRGGNTFGTKQNDRKEKICWRFNRGSCPFGTNCRFVHKCAYCDSTSHGANRCHKKQQKRQDKSKETRSEDKEGKDNETG